MNEEAKKFANVYSLAEDELGRLLERKVELDAKIKELTLEMESAVRILARHQDDYKYRVYPVRNGWGVLICRNANHGLIDVDLVPLGLQDDSTRSDLTVS